MKKILNYRSEFAVMLSCHLVSYIDNFLWKWRQWIWNWSVSCSYVSAILFSIYLNSNRPIPGIYITFIIGYNFVR